MDIPNIAKRIATATGHPAEEVTPTLWRITVPGHWRQPQLDIEADGEELVVLTLTTPEPGRTSIRLVSFADEVDADAIAEVQRLIASPGIKPSRIWNDRDGAFMSDRARNLILNIA